MNTFAIIAFFASLAVANAGVLFAPASRLGGSIVHEETAGFVAETAPVVAAAPALAYGATPVAFSAHAARAIAYPAHHAYTAPLISTYSAPLAYSSALVPEKQLDTVIAGPSGTIATSKTVHHPALVAEPQFYDAGVRAYYL